MSQKSVTLQLKISFNYQISLQKDENNEPLAAILTFSGSLSIFYAFFHKEETRCRIAELRFEE